MRRFLLISLLLLLIAATNFAYKILLYSPTVAHSHVMFFGKIANVLTDAGHNVTMFIPLMDPDVHTNGTNRAHVIRHEAVKNLPWRELSFKSTPFDDDFDFITSDTMNKLHSMYDSVCEAMITNEELIEHLRNEKYDLAMAEPMHYCGFGMFRILGIPAQIVASSVPLGEGHALIFGLPAPPSYVPSLWTGLSSDMSYVERVKNIIMTQYFLKIVEPRQNDMFRKYYGSNFPSFTDLAASSALMMVNGEEMFEFARPISHKIIYIGGIGIYSPKSLDNEMSKIVENSKSGVVYLSFGSISNSTLLPLSKKIAILEAFASFPQYTFIWKYEEPERDRSIFVKYPNVHPVRWAPQLDLLYHPKVVAFVTHCGGNSVTEAIHSGTPMVAIPLFGDQEHNAAVAVKRGVAVRVDKKSINTLALVEALSDVLHDERYTKNAKRLAAMIAKKPLKAKELVVKWTEFAAEFQDLSNLDVAGRNFSFAKYFCIDIFAPLAVIFLVILSLAIKMAIFIGKKLFLRNSAKEKLS